MGVNHEEAFVRAFILPQKQARYIQILANPKRRSTILSELYHSLDTIKEHTSPIASRDHSPVTVEKVLREKGPRKCVT